MSSLIICEITNHIGNKKQAERFDAVLDEYKDLIHNMPDILRGKDVAKVYIGFQFDCAGMPNAVRDIRLGRYSKKSRHLGADIEVKLADFSSLDAAGARRMVPALVIRALEMMNEKFKYKLGVNLGELIKAVRQLNLTFERSDWRR